MAIYIMAAFAMSIAAKCFVQNISKHTSAKVPMLLLAGQCAAALRVSVSAAD